MRRWWLLIVLCLALAGPGQAARDDADFYQADPAGDDYGPGTYIYPRNKAFEPWRGLYDLRAFAVIATAREVHFDLTLADLRNPWSAPEGFSHQLFEIYLHRGQGNGRTEPLARGAYVRFAPEYPWDVLLKAAPWDSSELIILGADGQPRKAPLQAGLAGPRTVRLSVPRNLIGEPQPSWRYYVLVGSYDGFGEDNFRPIMAKAGEWHFGGGRDDGLEPQVIDLLAPARGRYSQEKQLNSYDPKTKQPALLMPVGPGFIPGTGVFPWTLVLVLGGLLILAAWWNWYAPPGWRERFAEAARRIGGRVRGGRI
ncbi:MAG: glucodextranase DOMON-like domain-containing protein [Bacteroidota bacterium]